MKRQLAEDVRAGVDDPVRRLDVRRGRAEQRRESDGCRRRRISRFLVTQCAMQCTGDADCGGFNVK